MLFSKAPFKRPVVRTQPKRVTHPQFVELDRRIEEAAELISQARKPVLYVGGSSR